METFIWHNLFHVNYWIQDFIETDLNKRFNRLSEMVTSTWWDLGIIFYSVLFLKNNINIIILKYINM